MVNSALNPVVTTNNDPPRSRSTVVYPAATLDGIAWPEMLGGPCEQSDWAFACATTLRQDRQLAVATVRESSGGSIAGIAAWGLQRRHGVVRLISLGAEELAEPSGFATIDAAAADQLAERLISWRRPILAPRMFADSATANALRTASRGRAWLVERPRSECPYIDLDPSWQDALSHLSAGRRSDMRRAHRKAEQWGPVSAEIITPQLHELDSLFNRAIDVEARSWKGEVGAALTQDLVRQRFFRNYARLACERGRLRFAFLNIGDTVAAMQLAVVCNDRYWLLKIGYDPQFASCSPGQLLVWETIQQTAAAGLSGYEFLGRSDTWIRVWTPVARPCVAMSVYPYGFSGLTAMATDGIAAAVRKRFSS